jgi:hypothetical protein
MPRVNDTQTPSTGSTNNRYPRLKYMRAAVASTDAYLIELGDFLLMESGDKYLLE